MMCFAQPFANYACICVISNHVKVRPRIKNPKHCFRNPQIGSERLAGAKVAFPILSAL